MVFEGERCLKYNKVDNNNMIGTLYNLHTFDYSQTIQLIINYELCFYFLL